MYFYIRGCKYIQRKKSNKIDRIEIKFYRLDNAISGRKAKHITLICIDYACCEVIGRYEIMIKIKTKTNKKKEKKKIERTKRNGKTQKTKSDHMAGISGHTNDR